MAVAKGVETIFKNRMFGVGDVPMQQPAVNGPGVKFRTVVVEGQGVDRGIGVGKKPDVGSCCFVSEKVSLDGLLGNFQEIVGQQIHPDLTIIRCPEQRSNGNTFGWRRQIGFA